MNRRSGLHPPGRCFAAFEGAAASKAIQGAGCRSTPSAESSVAGQVAVTGDAAAPTGCPRASWQHGAPSLASATVADKAGGDHTTIFPAEGG